MLWLSNSTLDHLCYKPTAPMLRLCDEGRWTRHLCLEKDKSTFGASAGPKLLAAVQFEFCGCKRPAAGVKGGLRATTCLRSIDR
jgi:hypothetical protein